MRQAPGDFRSGGIQDGDRQRPIQRGVINGPARDVAGGCQLV